MDVPWSPNAHSAAFGDMCMYTRRVYAHLEAQQCGATTTEECVSIKYGADALELMCGWPASEPVIARLLWTIFNGGDAGTIALPLDLSDSLWVLLLVYFYGSQKTIGAPFGICVHHLCHPALGNESMLFRLVKECLARQRVCVAMTFVECVAVYLFLPEPSRNLFNERLRIRYWARCDMLAVCRKDLSGTAHILKWILEKQPEKYAVVPDRDALIYEGSVRSRMFFCSSLGYGSRWSLGVHAARIDNGTDTGEGYQIKLNTANLCLAVLVVQCDLPVDCVLLVMEQIMWVYLFAYPDFY